MICWEGFAHFQGFKNSYYQMAFPKRPCQSAVGVAAPHTFQGAFSADPHTALYDRADVTVHILEAERAQVQRGYKKVPPGK